MSDVKLNDTSKGILGDAHKKIGSFTESTGGGTPLKKGQKLKDHPEAHRVSQPRDEDGQFTYNSVNGKGLKYGPSRGTTVPPFLKGIKLTYCEPGTKLKIDGDDGIKIKIMTVDMSMEQIVANCKEYIEEEGGFAGMGEGSSITKKGRKSEGEKNAISGQVGHVDPKTLAKSTQDDIAKAAKEYIENNSAAEIAPLVKNIFTPGDGYQVHNDTLNPDGTTTKNAKERYHEWYKRIREGADSQKSSTPTPTPQPEPQPEPQPVTPSGSPAPTNNGGGNVDHNLAKSNPKEFINSNRENIDKVKEALKSSVVSGMGVDFSDEDIAELLSSGEYSSFDDLINEIKNYKED